MRGERLQSVDLVRGLIMVVMAIDHVRDMLGNAHFDPTDLTLTTPLLFVTRLVTHLCAPGFVMLAGTGAWLSGKPPRELSRFLLTRGLWLVVVELTIVRLEWCFNFDYARYPPGLQVIWVLGWSMVILAALVWLPRPAILAFGLVLCFGHNLLDGWTAAELRNAGAYTGATARDWLVSLLHISNFPVLYPLLPWPGVMAVGYALGPVFRFEPERRRRTLLLLGVACVALFFVLRAWNVYGDPLPWTPHGDRTWMSFLRVEKYPPSLDFLLLTCGPLFVILALAERVRAGWLVVFGRVPFFFYVAHGYVIHAVGVGLGLSTGFTLSSMLVPWPRLPEGFGLPLGGVYLVWVLVVAALYPACRWFAEVKRARREVWWLSYL